MKKLLYIIPLFMFCSIAFAEVIIEDNIPYKVTKAEIDTLALEAKKKQLQEKLDSLPKKKDNPDEETLNLYNAMIPDRAYLQKQIDDIQTKLDEIEQLKSE